MGFGQNISNQKNASLSVTKNQNASQSIDPFATVALSAKSAYVFDLKKQKVLFAKNADETLPLASIAKMMTALVASQLLAPDAVVTIDKTALAQEGDSGLMLGEKWRFDQLLDFTLAVSSNDGAVAIAEATSPNFVEKMNEKAQSLNLNSMHFFNATGLDESLTQSGAYASARDLAKLFEYILKTHPEIFTATTYDKFTLYSLDNIKHVAINTDADVDKIPNIIGSKTGYTDLAGGNLAIVYDASVNYPIIVVVLGSTYYDRFTDIADLVGATNTILSF